MTTSLNRDTLAQISPKLAQLSQQILFDDIWQRPQLARRDRSLVTRRPVRPGSYRAAPLAYRLCRAKRRYP